MIVEGYTGPSARVKENGCRKSRLISNPPEDTMAPYVHLLAHARLQRPLLRHAPLRPRRRPLPHLRTVPHHQSLPRLFLPPGGLRRVLHGWLDRQFPPGRPHGHGLHGASRHGGRAAPPEPLPAETPGPGASDLRAHLRVRGHRDLDLGRDAGTFEEGPLSHRRHQPLRLLLPHVPSLHHPRRRGDAAPPLLGTGSDASGDLHPGGRGRRGDGQRRRDPDEFPDDPDLRIRHPADGACRQHRRAFPRRPPGPRPGCAPLRDGGGDRRAAWGA